MRIEDKDIDKLLEDFQGENIKIPDDLDIKLNEKLRSLKPRNRYFLKGLVASVLVVALSYSTVPSFKTFADNVFKYIFGDIGIENAVNNGLESIPSKEVVIDGYNITIDNIYMDSLRISFDATINNYNKMEKDEYGEIYQHSLYVDIKGNGSISVDNGLFVEQKDKYKSNVMIMGDRVSEIYNTSPDKIDLELKLVKHVPTLDENKESTLKDKVLGKAALTFDIPKEFYNSKTININKQINDNKLKLDIEKLEVSPTMMYLYSKGKLDKYDVYGLYNLKIESDDKIYTENLSLYGFGGEDRSWKQTMIPSIYYDNSNKIKLKAEGVSVNVMESIDIKLNDNYPKEIDYFGTTMIIKSVQYKDNELYIEIIGNDSITSIAESTIKNAESLGVGSGGDENGNKIYYFTYKVDKRDVYTLDLNFGMKYKIPIEIYLKN